MGLLVLGGLRGEGEVEIEGGGDGDGFVTVMDRVRGTRMDSTRASISVMVKIIAGIVDRKLARTWKGRIFYRLVMETMNS